MTAWHERRSADLSLRAGGLMLLGAAWLLGSWLVVLVRSHAPHESTPREMAVGLLMFFSGAAGAAALALGKHLFDKVEISERWASPTARR
jgi:hypothetical protein